MTRPAAAAGFALDALDVSELFPFYLAVDRAMRIVSAGPSLLRIQPDITGLELSAVFELRRPSELTFEAVASGYEPLCILAARQSGLLLRGQFRFQPGKDKLLFVGSPWVTSLGMLRDLGLKLSDFAIHEPVVDVLQLMQAQAAATNEAKSIGKRLCEQRRELEHTLRWLTLQYAVSDALLTGDEGDVSERILSLLCQSTEWQAGTIWLDDADASQLRAAVIWHNLEAPAAMTQQDALLGRDADALVAEVWRSGVPQATSSEEDAIHAGARYACPIVDSRNRPLGVLEMAAPTSTPGVGTSMAISEVGIKLGMYIERTRANAALMEAKNQAEAGTRAKSEFLANVSHELRTPLNGLLGTAQLLAESQLPPLARSYVKTLLSSGNSLLSIINDLLDLAKIEAGKLDLELQDCDPLQVLEEGVEHFLGSAQSKRLLLLAEVHTARHVRCDPLRLRQVIWNLMGNAIKFTSSGYVRVVIREEESERSALIFEVQDSGIGIAQPRAKQLFLPFEQADPSVSRSYGGTGLGLAICKRLVTLMGGEIGLRSQEGTGSTFWFTLPHATEQSSPTVPPDHAHALAYIIHSDPVIRSALCVNVARAGYRTVELASPGEALLHSTHVNVDRPAWVILESTLARDPQLRTWLEHTGARVVWYAGWNGAQLGYESDTLHGAVTPTRVRSALGLQRMPGPSSSAHKVLAAPRPPGPRRGLVLLVEDNAVNQLVASAMLKQLGFAVDVAASGQQCLDMLARARYSVVLMDCQMPELDGFDTTRLIRKLDDDEAAAVPVIALTAGARETDRQRCIDAGMDDFLSKPIQRHALEQTLVRWIRDGDHTGQRTLLG